MRTKEEILKQIPTNDWEIAKLFLEVLIDIRDKPDYSNSIASSAKSIERSAYLFTHK